MTQTLLLFAGAFLLAIGVATLLVAVSTLRTARRYVDLAEERLEALREGQARLFARLEEQRRVVEKEREEVEEGIRAHGDAEQSIERAKRELLELRAGRDAAQARREPFPPGPRSQAPEARGRRQEPPPEKLEKAGDARPPAGLPETRSPKTGEPRKDEDKPPRRAVVRPHPDDDVRPGSTLAGQVREAGGSPIRMFRVFYDRYLDNYEGYVKLAEHIHRARTDEERVPGSRAEREWQERLRRANDGIRRTAERLDILEHSNPELASDDRVSRRAAIARSHKDLSR